VVTTTTTVTEQPATRFGNGAYFGIGAGANFPQNNINAFYRPGVNANAVLGWDPAVSPIGLRLNVAYNRLQGETIATVPGGATTTETRYLNADLFSGFLDAKLRLPFGRLFGATSGLYAVAGPGVTYFRNYQNFQATTGTGVVTPDNALYRNATRFAVNGGAGLDFGIGPASLFLEGRYVRTFTQGRDTDYLPVTIGLRFQTR